MTSALSKSLPPLGVTGDGTLQIFGKGVFVESLDEFLAELSKIRESGRAELVVTANVDQLIDLRYSAKLDAGYSAAALVVLDGMPLVALARALGAANVHRITGADLIDDLSRVARERGWRIAITGGAGATSSSAARRLSEKYGADVVSVPFPLLVSMNDPAALSVVKELRALEPDIVFVCLGAPKQEDFFVAWREQLPPSVYIGAGAAVDFAADKNSRAPRIVQKLGAEWVWRVIQEPRRLGPRYFIKGPRFLTLAAISLWRRPMVRRRD